MSGDVILFKGQKVAKAFAHLNVDQSLGDGIQGGFPSIGYRGKVWTLRYQGESHNFVRADDGSALTYLDTIVVGASPAISKVYYPPGEWDEESADAPLCASVTGIAPDPGVPEPQSRTCGMCKNNAWTTLPNGKRGKPCQDHKRLAVLLMPAMTSKLLGAPLMEPVYLKVPPGSLTALKSYGDTLRHQGFPFASVVTRISFSQDKLFQITFAALKPLTDVEAPLVLPLLDDPRTKRITGETPEIRESKPKPIPEEREDTGLAEAFANQAKLNGAAANKPAQQELLPPDDDVAEPAVKRGRGRPPKAATPAQAAPVAQATQAALDDDEPAAPAHAVPWDDVDSDLDGEISDLLNAKTADMLK